MIGVTTSATSTRISCPTPGSETPANQSTTRMVAAKRTGIRMRATALFSRRLTTTREVEPPRRIDAGFGEASYGSFGLKLDEGLLPPS